MGPLCDSESQLHSCGIIDNYWSGYYISAPSTTAALSPRPTHVPTTTAAQQNKDFTSTMMGPSAQRAACM